MHIDKKENIFSATLNAEMRKFGEIRNFPEGTVIVNENSYIRSIPIVIKGSIRVMKNEDGNEILLYYISEGESCIMSFLGGIHQDTSKITAIAEEDSEVLFIPVNKAGQWIKEFPEWSDYIFKLYHKRFEELLEVVNSVAFHTLDARIMHFLNQKAQLMQTREIQVTHRKISEELGTAREAVSRVLKSLEKKGKIKTGRNKIQLL